MNYRAPESTNTGRTAGAFRSEADPMNLPSKANLLQAYQVFLYDRALHPDVFPLKARRVIHHGEYELDIWVMPGSHALRFDHNKSFCATELLSDHERAIPQTGIVSHFLCAGERDYEYRFAKSGVSYITTVQTETLTDNLYSSTYAEMLDFARSSQALAHRWEDEAGKCLSMVDAQRYAREVHAQTFHLIASIGLVLRTQTIFELGKQPATAGVKAR